jgi:2-phosphosulfolactate phosphatase
VAIIDVFRPFTTAAVASANGASKIVMVGTVEEASRRARLATPWPSTSTTRRRYRARLLRPEGETGYFVAKHRRWEAALGGISRQSLRFAEKHPMASISATRRSKSQASISASKRSSSGPALGRKVSSPPVGSNELYAVSLVTAEANVRVILAGSPDQVCLVAMGENGLKRTDEDELCAIHLRNRLESRPGDPDAVRRLILVGGEVRRFHDPSRPYLRPEDVDIALDIDRHDFAIRVEFENGRPVARAERPEATNSDD